MLRLVEHPPVLAMYQDEHRDPNDNRVEVSCAWANEFANNYCADNAELEAHERPRKEFVHMDTETGYLAGVRSDSSAASEANHRNESTAKDLHIEPQRSVLYVVRVILQLLHEVRDCTRVASFDLSPPG